MIGDALALIEFLRKHYDEYHVLSALFDWTGKRIEGDRELSVEKIPHPHDDAKWFYRITGPEGYVFVHMPITAGVYIDHALVEGRNPDANYFRYVNTPVASVTTGGVTNTKVNFIVYGYRPKDLLKVKRDGP